MKYYKQRNNRHGHRDEPKDFKCGHCRRIISGSAHGTLNRNHCPWCLWSRHVDDRIGDRASECNALMEPVGVWVKRNGEWAILHRCCECGMIRANRIAGDDSAAVLMSLAVRPLASPPFPLSDEAEYLPLFRKM